MVAISDNDVAPMNDVHVLLSVGVGEISVGGHTIAVRLDLLLGFRRFLA